MELLFWVFVGLFAFLVAAGGVEWILSRPDRSWVRRLHSLERARCDWQARVVASQNFWRDKQ
jgi:hypothetical protein